MLGINFDGTTTILRDSKAAVLLCHQPRLLSLQVKKKHFQLHVTKFKSVLLYKPLRFNNSLFMCKLVDVLTKPIILQPKTRSCLDRQPILSVMNVEACSKLGRLCNCSIHSNVVLMCGKTIDSCFDAWKFVGLGHLALHPMDFQRCFVLDNQKCLSRKKEGSKIESASPLFFMLQHDWTLSH